MLAMRAFRRSSSAVAAAAALPGLPPAVTAAMPLPDAQPPRCLALRACPCHIYPRCCCSFRAPSGCGPHAAAAGVAKSTSAGVALHWRGGSSSSTFAACSWALAALCGAAASTAEPLPLPATSKQHDRLRGAAAGLPLHAAVPAVADAAPPAAARAAKRAASAAARCCPLATTPFATMCGSTCHCCSCVQQLITSGVGRTASMHGLRAAPAGSQADTRCRCILRMSACATHSAC